MTDSMERITVLHTNKLFFGKKKEIFCKSNLLQISLFLLLSIVFQVSRVLPDLRLHV